MARDFIVGFVEGIFIGLVTVGSGLLLGFMLGRRSAPTGGEQ